MENIDYFFNEIKNCFEKSQFSPQELLILAVIGFLCIAVILWMPLRGLRLWYWKTNKQIILLEKIESRLNKLSDSDRQEDIKKHEPNSEEDKPEEVEMESQETYNESEHENIDLEPQAIRGYNVSRSGRVYTKEEIQKLIKD